MQVIHKQFTSYVIVSSIVLVLADRYCKDNSFSNSHGICQPFLLCSEIDQVELKEEIISGHVKKLFIGSYDGLHVVYSTPRYEYVKADFLHGINMLKAFQHSEHVATLVGYCDDINKLTLITKYYQHGSADDFNTFIERLNLPLEEEIRIRMKLCLDYLLILEFLHDSPLGVRVMCDSNDLQKTLSQFLISDDFHLVVSDLDALPEVNNTIKCGHKQLFGDFVAPEQLWPHENLVFNDLYMKGYTEKVDIWKIPNVLSFLLGKGTVGKQTKFHMFNVFWRCKEVEYSKRPTATEIRQTFLTVIEKLQVKTEL